MNPNERVEICRKAFMKILKQDSGLQKRTWCVFDPYKDKYFNLVIVIANKETGYGVPVTIDKKYLSILDASIIEAVMVKILKPLQIVINKHSDKAKPVNYQERPLKVQGKTSVLDSVSKVEKSTVEFYRWSMVLV